MNERQKIVSTTLEIWEHSGGPNVLVILPPELAENTRVRVTLVRPGGTSKRLERHYNIGTANMGRCIAFQVSPCLLSPNPENAGSRDQKQQDSYGPQDEGHAG